MNTRTSWDRFRWVFPESWAEIFGELGRDDYSADIRDFVMQPEHAQAYLLGLHKLFGTANGKLRHVELAHTLEKPTNNPTRPVPIFYTRSYELQGYTNRGQMIGAGIGPRLTASSLRLTSFTLTDAWGFGWNASSATIPTSDNLRLWLGQDAEIAGGFRGVMAWHGFELGWSRAWEYRFNMNFGSDATSPKTALDISWVGERPSRFQGTMP
jgi:hypothetical protein